jgi:hypothetical protein
MISLFCSEKKIRVSVFMSAVAIMHDKALNSMVKTCTRAKAPVRLMVSDLTRWFDVVLLCYIYIWYPGEVLDTYKACCYFVLSSNLALLGNVPRAKGVIKTR